MADKAKETAAAAAEPACSMHHKDGAAYKRMMTRLKRIEGQVRGIEKMVEDDRYCIDILTQVTAIQSALTAFNKELLADHIHTCVVDDVRAGKEEALDELVTTLQKLVK